MRDVSSKIFVTLGAALAMTFVIAVYGSVSGIEFCPDTFETRRFSVREIPWLEIQIMPIRRTTEQSSLARYLAAQSLLTPAMLAPSTGTETTGSVSTAPAATANTTTWHLVELRRGNREPFRADAKLLSDHINAYGILANNQTTYDDWHQWSLANPAKANVLWPKIQSLAKRELYILMPPLFDAAIKSADEMKLQAWLDDYLPKNYAELVNEMRDAERREVADELLSEALREYPDHETLRGLQ